MLIRLLLLAVVLIGSVADARPHVCFPRNRLRIPPGHRFANDMTKAQFLITLAKIRDIHQPYFAMKNSRLRIKADWDDAAVNAFADREYQDYIIEVFGGLARHPSLTRDGFTLVVCHELGHHLGGVPTTSKDYDWPSSEGQSDYFATLKCLRRIFQDEDNEVVLRGQKIDPILMARCQRNFSTPLDRMICVRAGLAGLSAARLFHELDHRGGIPDFSTPDPRVVTKTDTNHPEPQCRLDTYVAGAACPADASRNPDARDPRRDVCYQDREPDGFRPRCWYRPTTAIRR